MNNIPVLSSTVSKSTYVNGKIIWPKASSIKQQPFSLPDSLIYYITKNPATPKVYLKMAQSCKYFFEKNPLLVVRRIHGDGRKYCSVKYGECRNNNQKCCVEVDATKLTSKIWLTYQLEISENAIPNLASTIVPKIYRSQDAELSLCCLQINWDDFKSFAWKFSKFLIYCNRFVDNDGNNVMLDSILKAIPVIVEFHYLFDVYNSSLTSSTMKNISKLQNIGNLRNFSLNYIPEVIAVQDIADFIKDHKYTNMKFDFKPPISREYKKQLDALVDTIIASDIQHCLIRYARQKEEKYWSMIEQTR